MILGWPGNAGQGAEEASAERVSSGASAPDEKVIKVRA